MKKQTFKAIVKKISVLSIATVLLISSNVMAFPDAPAMRPVEVTYAGTTQDNLLVFQIHFNNIAGEKFILELYNNDHDLLYSRKYNDKLFKTRIYLQKQPESGKVTFTIRSGKKAYSQTFELLSQTKEVENITVKIIN